MKTGLGNLKYNQKRRIFEMLAALAMQAGAELSEDDFRSYQDTMFAYLERCGLLDDFMEISKAVGMEPHPALKRVGRC